MVKNSVDATDFRLFLEGFPDGANAAKAKIRLEDLVWKSVKDLGRSTDKAKVQAYLNEFPNGANATAARIKLRQLEKLLKNCRLATEEERKEKPSVFAICWRPE